MERKDGTYWFQRSPAHGPEQVKQDDGRVFYSEGASSLSHFARRFPEGKWGEPVKDGAAAPTNTLHTHEADEEILSGELRDGINLMREERFIHELKGYHAAHDDQRTDGSLLSYAHLIIYEIETADGDLANAKEVEVGPDAPWHVKAAAYTINKHRKNVDKLLVIAGSLIAAEIDRRERARKEAAVTPAADTPATPEPPAPAEPAKPAEEKKPATAKPAAEKAEAKANKNAAAKAKA